MNEINRLAIEIKCLAENSNPVIYDLSERLLHLLESEKFYTRDEVIKMLERTDPHIDNDQGDY